MTEKKQLSSNLEKLVSILDSHGGREKLLMDALDAAENAVCIYDKDATLLYGNKSYFHNMQISDPQSALGKNILDITRQLGIKVHSKKTGSSNLKMLDVLKTGKKILDWEVSIESETSSNNARFISYNMYPILNPDNGAVEGMIEISHSHQMNLNKTKKIMGLTAEYTFDSILGTSAAIRKVIAEAKDYAESPYNLLIVGESGVGKELFSHAVHNHSNRSNGPFVAINCANFPENLIESELFGYVGGAFTGASKNGQIGKFELADGGTIFLDEIGELTFHFQSKLLRVLETQKITRIGSSRETPVNVRVIAATNRDLEKMMEEGLFRKDLYYRLQVLNIYIPPLRNRKEDLKLLASSLLMQAAQLNGGDLKTLEHDAERCLLEYDWPGNVRELKNVVQRVYILSKSSVIDRETLESAIFSKGYALKPSHTGQYGFSPLAETDAVSGEMHACDASTPPESAEYSVPTEDNLDACFAAVDAAYTSLLHEALKQSRGNKKKAAGLLGISRQTFYRMLTKYNI